MEKYFQIFLILILISIGGILTTSFTTQNSSITQNVTVYSPSKGEIFHPGDQLSLLIGYEPNASATISLLIPSKSSIPEGTLFFNNSGYLSVNLGTFGSGYLSSFGEYIIEIDIDSGKYAITIPVYYQPYLEMISVKVINNYGSPIQNALVSLYNMSGIVPSVITTGYTNVSGYAIFSVNISTATQPIKITATSPGYTVGNDQITIIPKELSNNEINVELTLNPVVLNVFVVGAEQNDLYIDPLNSFGYTTLVANSGENLSIFLKTTLNGIQINNSTVYVQIITPQKIFNETAVPSNNSLYKITFMLPLLNTSYEVNLIITAKYESVNTTLVLPIVAQYNNTEIIQQLQNQIINLDNKVNSLENDTVQLNATLTKLSNETVLLQKSTNQLEKAVDSLNQEIPVINSQISQLDKKLDQITPLIYIALIVGIIGVVLAIMSLISIRRALS